MRKSVKKVVACILIISNIIANTGFSVLAESVNTMVYDTLVNQKEQKNYYYLYEKHYEYEYEETIVQESKNNENAMDESSSIVSFDEDINSKIIEEEELENEYEMEEPEEDEETIRIERERKEDTEDNKDNNNSENYEIVKFESEDNNIENNIENNNEITNKYAEIEQQSEGEIIKKEEGKNVKNIDIQKNEKEEDIIVVDSEEEEITSTSENELDDSITTESIIIDVVPYDEVKEATESETLETEENKTASLSEIDFIVELSTESEVVINREKATDSEIVVEGEKATGSEIATDSEVVAEGEKATGSEIATTSEIATNSEIVAEGEKATESEIATGSKIATDSEIATRSDIATKSQFVVATKSIIIVATVSVVEWTIENIFIASYSESDVLIDEIKNATVSIATLSDRLRKTAKVLVKNNIGESKIIEVKLNWKLKKQLKIATRSDSKTFPYKKEKWQKDFGIEEMKKEKVFDNGSISSDSSTNCINSIATNNEINVTQKVIEDIKYEYGDDAIVIVNIATANKLKGAALEKEVYEIDEKEVERIREKCVVEKDFEEKILKVINKNNEEEEKNIEINSEIENEEKIKKDIEEESEKIIQNVINEEEEIKEEKSISTKSSIYIIVDETIGESINLTNKKEKEIIEEIVPTESVNHDEEIQEPTVADFSNSNIVLSTNSSIDEGVIDNGNEESNNNNQKENINNIEQTNNIINDKIMSEEKNLLVTSQEDVEEKKSTSSIFGDEIKNMVYISGVNETEAGLNGEHDVVEMDVYELDMNDITKQVFDAINGSSDEKEKSKNIAKNDNEINDNEINDNEINDNEIENKNEKANTIKDILSILSGIFSIGENQGLTEEDDEKNNQVVESESASDNSNNLEEEKNVINKIKNNSSLIIPFTTVNLFGNGVRSVPHSDFGNIHPLCGHEFSSINQCNGHPETEEKHIIKNYNPIPLSMAEKNLATISITEDKAYFLKSNSGTSDLLFTMYNIWEISTNANLYICTNGIDIKFSTSSKICGNGNIYICNCQDNAITHITTENDWVYYDKYGKIWPATMSRNENRWYPLIDVKNVYIYGSDNKDIDDKNIQFENIKIKNYFVANCILESVVDGIVSKEYSSKHSYGSIIVAKNKLHLYHIKFDNFIGTRCNGAVHAGDGDTVIYDDEFYNMTVKENGGAICLGDKNSIKVKNCLFYNCVSRQNGGAIYIEGVNDTSNNKKIEECVFIGNKASVSGAGIYIKGFANYEFNGLAFSENEAGVCGGAIGVEQNNSGISTRKLFIKDSDFYNNKAKSVGGAIYLNSSNNSNQRTAMMSSTDLLEVSITNSSFVENCAIGTEMLDGYYYNSFGGAIYTKGRVKLNIGTKSDASSKVVFENNKAVNGGAICAGQKAFADTITPETYIESNAENEVNCYYGEMKGNGMANSKTADTWKKLSWGGGAIYAMRRAIINLEQDFIIDDNDDAVYACDAKINIKSKITENNGRYAIGYTNNRANEINFKDGAKVENNVLLNGETKDFVEYYNSPETKQADPKFVINTTTTFASGKIFNKVIKMLAGNGSAINELTENINIEKIKWERELPKNEYNEIKGYDVSISYDGREITDFTTLDDAVILAWYDKGIIKLYTKSDMAYLNEDSSYMFANLKNVVDIDMSKFGFDTLVDASYMFYNDTALRSLDLTNLNTCKVEDYTNFLSYCTSLYAIDLTALDTSNAITMKNMFAGSAIYELDLTSFDTKNVNDMSYMFYGCNNLRKINTSTFNTSKVTTFESMFDGCKDLKYMDLSNFVTEMNLINIKNMFNGCSNIEEIDLSSFNVSKVVNMEGSFRDCTNLLKIYASDKWSKNPLLNNLYTFSGCTSLTGYESSKVTAMYAKIYINELSSDFGYLTLVDKPEYKNATPMCLKHSILQNDINGKILNWNIYNAKYKQTKITFAGTVLVEDNYWLNNSSTNERNIHINTKTTKIGFDDTFSSASSVGLYLDEKDLESIVFDNWKKGYNGLFNKYNKGYLFNTFFTIDASEPGDIYENCKFYRNNNEIHLGRECLEVAFDYATTGAKPNPKSQYISKIATKTYIDMPEELLDKSKFSITGKSFLGFISKDANSRWDIEYDNEYLYYEDGYYINNFKLWNYDVYKTSNMYKNDSDGKITLIGVYLLKDDETKEPTVKLRTCGCRATESCSHIGIKGNHSIMDATDIAHTFIEVTRDEQLCFMYASGSEYARPGYYIVNDIKINNDYEKIFSKGQIVHFNGHTINNYRDTAPLFDMTKSFGDNTRLNKKITYVYEKAQVNVDDLVEKNERNKTVAEMCSSEIFNLTLKKFNNPTVTNVNTIDNYIKEIHWVEERPKGAGTYFDVSLRGKGLEVSDLTTVGDDAILAWYDGSLGIVYLWTACDKVDLTWSTESMFEGFKSLEYIDMFKFDKKNMNNVSKTFVNCTSLKTIDISMINLQQLEKLENMFDGCENLETIYVSDDWKNIDEKIIDDSKFNNMFKNCYKLVGGNGTKFGDKYVNRECACIDGLNGKKGYLTLKKSSDWYKLWNVCWK